MPVGTQAVVKALTASEVEPSVLGILGNTYHLAVRPGIETVRALGGMHEMYNWSRSILTDSSGFKFCHSLNSERLARRVAFRSHIDGSLLKLTPEHAIGPGSHRLGYHDVFGPLPATTAPRKEVEDAMARTTRWAKRCLAARQRSERAVFAIIQGVLSSICARAVEELCSEAFDSRHRRSIGWRINPRYVCRSRMQHRRCPRISRVI